MLSMTSLRGALMRAVPVAQRFSMGAASRLSQRLFSTLDGVDSLGGDAAAQQATEPLMVEPWNTTWQHMLCFGDDNTWGYDPNYVPSADPEADMNPASPPPRHRRLPFYMRWPGVLQQCLNAYAVFARAPLRFTAMEDGLCGRTTAIEDPLSEGVSTDGRTALFSALMTHRPLDMVVMQLGLNDCKARFGLSVDDIVLGVENLIREVRGRGSLCGSRMGFPPAVFLLPPPTPHMTDEAKRMGFDEHSIEKATSLPAALEQLAKETNCGMLGGGEAEEEVAKAIQEAAEKMVVGKDGIHMPQASHLALGKALAAQLLRVPPNVFDVLPDAPDIETLYGKAEEASEEAAPEEDGEGVPVLITQKMKRRLVALGYGKDAIAELTPAEAHEIITSGTSAAARSKAQQE